MLKYTPKSPRQSKSEIKMRKNLRDYNQNAIRYQMNRIRGKNEARESERLTESRSEPWRAYCGNRDHDPRHQ